MPQHEELEIEACSDGDARRCPRHPHVATSSPDGLHDTPCGLCEQEMEALFDEEPHDGPSNDWKPR